MVRQWSKWIYPFLKSVVFPEGFAGMEIFVIVIQFFYGILNYKEIVIAEECPDEQFRPILVYHLGGEYYTWKRVAVYSANKSCQQKARFAFDIMYLASNVLQFSLLLQHFFPMEE